MRRLFTELLSRVPQIAAGVPTYYTSKLMSAVQSLPCVLKPA